MGPACANELIERDGRVWHRPHEKPAGNKP
jgi:glucose-6-phosphate 1-dehydrogenase